MNTKEIIIQKGVTLFAEKGYHVTSIKDIITEARIPKGSFYYYFESKEIFCLEVINKLTENIDVKINEKFQDPSTYSIEQIHLFLDDLFSTESIEGNLLLRLIIDLAKRNDYLNEALQLLILNIINKLVEIINSMSIKDASEWAKFLFYGRIGVLCGHLVIGNESTDAFNLFITQIKGAK